MLHLLNDRGSKNRKEFFFFVCFPPCFVLFDQLWQIVREVKFGSCAMCRLYMIVINKENPPHIFGKNDKGLISLNNNCLEEPSLIQDRFSLFSIFGINQIL